MQSNNRSSVEVQWYVQVVQHSKDRFCRVRVICRVLDLLQNRRVISVGYRMCYRTHRSVGYCGTTVTELTEVWGIVYRSLRVISVGYLICYRTHRSIGYVLWCNCCHRTHKSIGYCGTTVTELTEVQGNVVLRSQNSGYNLCRLTTDGHYPRYGSVLAHFRALGSTRFYYMYDNCKRQD